MCTGCVQNEVCVCVCVFMFVCVCLCVPGFALCAFVLIRAQTGGEELQRQRESEREEVKEREKETERFWEA